MSDCDRLTRSNIHICRLLPRRDLSQSPSWLILWNFPVPSARIWIKQYEMILTWHKTARLAYLSFKIGYLQSRQSTSTLVWSSLNDQRNLIIEYSKFGASDTNMTDCVSVGEHGRIFEWHCDVRNWSTNAHLLWVYLISKVIKEGDILNKYQ